MALWIDREVARLGKVEKVQQRLGMVSRSGAQTQLEAQALQVGPDGAPIVSVVDGEVVMGEEAAWLAVVAVELTLAGVDMKSPRRWERRRRRRRPLILGNETHSPTSSHFRPVTR